MVSPRRITWLLLACVAAAAAYAAWQQRRPRDVATTAPVWPPFDPPAAPATWVPPLDGACPPGYPVKAKQSSGIYHVPGGRFYDRTVPDRCYVDPAAAEADGYRASKS